MSEDALRARIAEVERRIARACDRAGRRREEVRLLAVSKKKPAAMIRAAYALGLRDFGENYAQELRDKALELEDLPGLRWHFIGPLQRNKAKYVVGRAELIHTIASAPLVETLSRLAAKGESSARLLVQVNVSGERSKSGIPPAELDALLEMIDGAESLRCCGLMTMPPWDEDPAAAAPLFARLRALRDERPGLVDLSMGMSHDLEIAIAEGATIVRVGSAIFGPRE